jgi:D-serine dehydratase
MDLSDFTPAAHAGELDATRLGALTKGVPPAAGGLTLGTVGHQGWNLLRGDLPLPAAVLHVERLRANSAWMAEFLALNGLAIAPHGKTTMAPQLFAKQLRDGAWAITVGTIHQLAVARHFGARRVLMANQPMGRIAVDACFAHLAADPGFELYLLADSLPGVAMLAAGAARAGLGPDRAIDVLLEVGYAGGRTGCRDVASALAVAEAVAATPGLRLAGVEAFEGLLATPEAVDGFLERYAEVVAALAGRGQFRAGVPIVLTAGGSAFFDRVARRLARIDLGAPVLRVIRSGCYIAHDSMGYEKQFRRMQAAGEVGMPRHDLQPALEVWAYVQSRPEPTKAIVNMGRRDIGTDAGWPVPSQWFRPGVMERPVAIGPGHAIEGLNDQHGHLALPPDSPLAVGDMLAFGMGHPCTTFDKWQTLMLVDPGYTVVGAVRTFF